jgi:hypothetical protein
MGVVAFFPQSVFRFTPFDFVGVALCRLFTAFAQLFDCLAQS